MMRKAFIGLGWLFVAAVAVQFFLAGLGVLGGEGIEAHRQWGFTAMHLLPVLMLVAAIVGRMGRIVIGLTIVLFVLVFLQPLFAAADLDPRWLRSIHVLNALVIGLLGFYLAQRGTRLIRSGSTAA